MLEELLTRDSRNPVIHSALGQLLMQAGKWQEARSHFEQALEYRTDVSDYAYLADVLDKLNQGKAASDVSRTALKNGAARASACGIIRVTNGKQNAP